MKWTIAFLLGAVVSVQAGDNPAKKDVDSLQGKWIVDVMEYNGKNVAAKYKIAFVFKGDTATVEGNDEVKQEYAKLVCKLDPSTMPKCVDMTVAGGVQNGAVMEGIYEIKGGELRMCVKVFGKDRPSEFKAPAGSSITLLVLKREK